MGLAKVKFKKQLNFTTLLSAVLHKKYKSKSIICLYLFSAKNVEVMQIVKMLKDSRIFKPLLLGFSPLKDEKIKIQ